MIKIRNEDLSYRIFYGFITVVMIAVVLACLIPYLYVVAIAFNNATDSMLGGIGLWPRKFSLENFKVILSSNTILKASMISVTRVLAGTFLQVFITFCAAYAFRKKSFPGRTWIMLYFLLPGYFSAGMIANYILYSKIHFLGNFFVYLFPTAFNFFYMVLLRTFMVNSIPPSLEESATIDGASEFRIMYSIYIPLSKPILATIALYSAVFHWNDWTTTLLYADKNPSIYPLQYIMMKVLLDSQSLAKMLVEAAMHGRTVSSTQDVVTPEAIKNAQIVITTIPIIMVYPFLQKYFIKGIMIGAVKE